MENKRFLEIGKITNVHGLHGEVKVIPWCDSAAFLCSFDELYINGGRDSVRVLRAREQKNMVILELEGCDTREKAEAMRGTVLYMDRDDVELEDGVYFIQDLIGLKVSDADSGTLYGTITDVLQNGANDVYVIRGEGREYLVPAIPEVILETDLNGGTMVIRPLKGLFDDED